MAATNNMVNKRNVGWSCYMIADHPNIVGNTTPIKVPFDATKFLTGGVSFASSTITVPVTGYYYVQATLTLGNVGTHTSAQIYISKTSGISLISSICNPSHIEDSANKLALWCEGVVYLTSSSLVTVAGLCSGGSVNVGFLAGTSSSPSSWFTGYLIS